MSWSSNVDRTCDKYNDGLNGLKKLFDKRFVMVKCKFIIIPKHKRNVVYEKWARHFFQIKEHNTRAHLCENNFYWTTIKIDNGAVAMRLFLCEANGIKNSINLKKDDLVE